MGVPAPATVVGCTEFEVRLGGPSGLVAAPVGDESCGIALPTLAGAPTYDAAHRVVRFSVAVRNAGVVQLHPPAALTARRGSLEVSAGNAIAGALRYTRGDSAAGDSLAPAGESRWSVDRLLGATTATPVTASDGAIVLGPATTSGPRTLGVLIPKGVTAFRVTLYGMGANVFTVPAQAPEQVPLDEVRDSRSPDNVLTNDPRFPGRVVRNKLWVMFRRDATVEQRQAAVDAVEGVVIGGHRVGPNPYYYLRIPANPDSGSRPLDDAIRALAIMPQVQHVLPDNLAGPGLAR